MQCVATKLPSFPQLNVGPTQNAVQVSLYKFDFSNLRGIELFAYGEDRKNG
ncbi:hypothetical protein SBDP1_730009 [Syntrophobacter sp. SbD1]|nr:hypothetical protein SBDP1_730009 [Syntrophobacter sp. SbD1]